SFPDGESLLRFSSRTSRLRGEKKFSLVRGVGCRAGFFRRIAKQHRTAPRGSLKTDHLGTAGTPAASSSRTFEDLASRQCLKVCRKIADHIPARRLSPDNLRSTAAH